MRRRVSKSDGPRRRFRVVGAPRRESRQRAVESPKLDRAGAAPATPARKDYIPPHLRSGPEPKGFAAYMRWLGFSEFTDAAVEKIHRRIDALTPGRIETSSAEPEWL